MWKFCGKIQFLKTLPKLYFSQNFYTRKLGQIMAFFALYNSNFSLRMSPLFFQVKWRNGSTFGAVWKWTGFPHISNPSISSTLFLNLDKFFLTNDFSKTFLYDMLVLIFTKIVCIRTIVNNPKQVSWTRDLEVDGCQSNLHFILKQLLVFISFATSFVGGILWYTDRGTIIYSKLCN